MNLLIKAKKLPNSPSVYLFLNQRGEVLYVGRAISLRRRVLNYFQKNFDPRIEEMIALAKKIKYRKTDNLLEAIILEANLIKKHWPKYNIKERDNRSFIYIVIPKTDYPKPLIVRGKELEKFLPQPGTKKDIAHIFGPYQSLSLIKTALRLIRRIFPYSTCKPNSGNPSALLRARPCFDYQIGLCPGTCIGNIGKDDYQQNIDNLILFLAGQKKKLIKKLRKENPFQEKGLKHIQDVALISREDIGKPPAANRIEGYDISHLAGKETIGVMVSFLNGVPNKNYYRVFKIREAPLNDDLRALEEVITRRFHHPEWPLPDLILIDGGRPQVNYVSKILKTKKINIPLIGISKIANDRLTFMPKTKTASKDLLETMKETLLRVRNEAHRFALKNSRYQRKLVNKL